MNEEPQIDLSKLPMTLPGRIMLAGARVPSLQVVGQSKTISLDDNDAMLSVLRANHVLDDQVLETHPPFFFAGEISNTRLDSYDTRMDPSTTLKHFVEDAIAGVSFCDTHNHNELAFGRSFAAALIGGDVSEDALLSDDTQQQSVFAAFYTLPNIKTNRVNTNDLIISIRGGMTKDLSVGFKPGPGFQYRCSICSRDLWDWDCEHIPGIVYEVTESDAPDAETVERYCFAWIVNARLSETSAAYDGATPQCMLLKASREAEAGRIPARVIPLVESRCRAHLPPKRTTIPAGNTRKDQHMNDEERRAQEERERAIKDGVRKQVDQLLGVARSSLVKLGIVKNNDDAERDVPDLDAAFTRLESECRRLQPLAADGVTLRKELVDSAIVEGKRLMGDKFDDEKQRKTLDALGIDDIKNLRTGWQEAADAKLGRGGRKTTDGERGADPEADDEGGEAAVDLGDEARFAGV